MIYLQLFWAFFQIGLFSVGGGYAAMPLIQAQTVDTFQWLTMQEFTNLVTIAEMTPGPIAINAATFVGQQIAGLPGAVLASIGCIFPSMIIVSILSKLYLKYQAADGMQILLSCLRPTVVALIASAALGILSTVIFNSLAPSLAHVHWISVLLFLAAFALLRIKKCSPILVMLLCGAIGLILHFLGISI